ncbi:MAG: hypothetical protein AAF078_00780 [Planctomycetota bacterium]
MHIRMYSHDYVWGAMDERLRPPPPPPGAALVALIAGWIMRLTARR